MLKMSDCFHNGIAVADIHSARDSLGQSLGVEWSPVRSFDPLPFTSVFGPKIWLMLPMPCNLRVGERWLRVPHPMMVMA